MDIKRFKLDNMNKIVKLYYPMTIAVLFIVLGFHLINKEDKFAVIAGFANIIFCSAIILFTLYKLVIKKQ